MKNSVEYCKPKLRPFLHPEQATALVMRPDDSKCHLESRRRRYHGGRQSEHLTALRSSAPDPPSSFAQSYERREKQLH